ncbi:MAG TPA: CsbD family protein [Vicinamibacterales bacterium]|nr:CsbD family protein [Vicinamibacterales bacterium]
METRGKKDDTLGEEVSGLGQRTKGSAKDMVGHIIGDDEMEAEGEMENAEGRARQASNNVMDETDGLRGGTAQSGRYVTGLYNSPESASRAYEGLTSKHGYKADDISVMMSDETRTRHFGDVKPGTELSGGTKAAEGLGKGAAIGGGVGAALAALFAIGTSIVIPGLGLVVAGPIAAALAGAGAGGATGGIIGALIGAGIPEDRAKEYERGINEGGILIGTRYRDDDHARELEQDFTSYGGSNVRY